ncbi:MAG: DUF5985 family protein [Myxococcota bacterium]
MIAQFVSGALATSYLVAATFFLRFRRDTGDRLFGFFAVAFALLAAQRTLLSFYAHEPRVELALYAIRALGFLVLAAGIVDKNRRS